MVLYSCSSRGSRKTPWVILAGSYLYLAPETIHELLDRTSIEDELVLDEDETIHELLDRFSIGVEDDDAVEMVEDDEETLTLDDDVALVEELEAI